MILGPGRGGTSLLAACLGAHSALKIDSELHGPGVLMGREFEGTRSVGSLLQERLDEFAARCDRDRAAARPLTWGNKITTEQIAGLEDHNTFNDLHGEREVDVVAAFVQRLREYRFVFIVRDGRSCAESKRRRRGIPLMLAAYRWRYGVRVLRTLRALGRLDALVSFEDLVTAPERTLTGLCGELGLPFEPHMLQQTKASVMPTDYRQPGFLAEKAVIPQLPMPILDYMASDLAYCGYA